MFFFLSNKIKNNHRGFSLLELVLAIAVFSLSSYGIATVLIDANITTRFGTERIEALFYAKEGVEATRSIRDNNWSAWSELADGDYGLINNNSLWSLSSTSNPIIDDKYIRTINLTTQADGQTKLVISTINWDLTPSRKVNVSLSTIFSNWANITE